MNFFNFFDVYKNIVFEKNWGYHRATASSITRKIILWDMKFCYKNIQNAFLKIDNIFKNKKIEFFYGF